MSSASDTVDPFIGREILDGQFKIVQKIGMGGMGAVYKALQPDMNRMVAVKVLHPKLADRRDIASRFRREARAMSHLTHPHTARVFMYDALEDGTLFIVMELLEGKTINRVVRAEGPMELRRALRIMMQVCGALEEAHVAGMVHRDLKPENVFLCKQGGLADFPKVLDFGLAKVTYREMQPGSVQLTREGMVFGTPEFMSPEQAQGRTLTPASDVYSLAVILYEMLTGLLPFDAKNPLDFLQLHVSAPPIPISERVEGLTFPPELWACLERALAKRPESRYASAAGFEGDLEEVLAGVTVLPARRSGAAPGSQLEVAAGAPAESKAAVAPAARAPSRPFVASFSWQSAAVGFVAAMVFAGVLLVSTILVVPPH